MLNIRRNQITPGQRQRRRLCRTRGKDDIRVIRPESCSNLRPGPFHNRHRRAPLGMY